MTLAVAFFRNLNLGHSGSPGREELLRAFEAAGAASARSFQTNGTVVLDAIHPTPLARRAARLLRDGCGWNDYVAVRSATWCLRLAARLRNELPPESTAECEVSLFDAPRIIVLPPLGRTADGRIDIVDLSFRHAVSRPQRLPGSATAALERLLPCPVTSRGAGTMLRLATLLASPRPC